MDTSPGLRRGGNRSAAGQSARGALSNTTTRRAAFDELASNHAGPAGKRPRPEPLEKVRTWPLYPAPPLESWMHLQKVRYGTPIHFNLRAIAGRSACAAAGALPDGSGDPEDLSRAAVSGFRFAGRAGTAPGESLKSPASSSIMSSTNGRRVPSLVFAAASNGGFAVTS